MERLKRVLIITLIVIIIFYMMFLAISFILWYGKTLDESNQKTEYEVNKLLEMDEIYAKADEI